MWTSWNICRGPPLSPYIQKAKCCIKCRKGLRKSSTWQASLLSVWDPAHTWISSTTPSFNLWLTVEFKHSSCIKMSNCTFSKTLLVGPLHSTLPHPVAMAVFVGTIDCSGKHAGRTAQLNWTFLSSLNNAMSW